MLRTRQYSLTCRQKEVQGNNSFHIYNASAGSGKTYALTKSYLAIALRSPGRFRHILAITFTNKAVNEMKGRIINSLNQFASCDPKNNKNPLFLELRNILGITPRELQLLSKDRLREILHNYAFFDVSTIDKFTHRLIRTFAKDLKLPQHFEVVLEEELLLAEAVDRVIGKAGEDMELTKILLDFALEKIDDDKSWDVGYDLLKMGKQLLDENNMTYLETLQKKPTSDFLDLQKRMLTERQKSWETMKSMAAEALRLIRENGLAAKDFTGGYFPKFMQDLLDGKKEINFNAAWKRDFGARPLYNKTAPSPIKATIDALFPVFQELFANIKDAYFKNRFYGNVHRNIVPLALLNTIQKEMSAIGREKDQLPISKFNTIISNQIINQPAPFIYERLGEKYRHYFIDEFQDTSTMQWNNLVPLIGNALESQDFEGRPGSLFLVGDAKQAIYRWRGGRAEQFLRLATHSSQPFTVDAQTTVLPKNFRSLEEIVHFNNGFFQSASAYLRNGEYALFFKEGNKQDPVNGKGGLVQLSFLDNPLEEDYCQKTQNTITAVLAHGYAYGDICILTRKKKQGALLARYLMEKGIPVVSPDSLLISQSPKVSFLVDLAQYMVTPQDQETVYNMLSYLYRESEDKHVLIYNGLGAIERTLKENYAFSFSKFEQNTLFDAFEYAIKCFDLVPDSDAHITAFMDTVLDFSLKHGTDLPSFLVYWSTKGHKKNIGVPEEMNAIHIMTIHKAKGLEFPVVIFPFATTKLKEEIAPMLWIPVDPKFFCGFEALLVNKNKDLREYSMQAAAIYDDEEEKLQLDAMNLLYVALTRAVKALYIITERNATKGAGHNTNTYSGLFSNYLEQEGLWHQGQTDHTFGKLSSPKAKTLMKDHSAIIPYVYTRKDRSGPRIVTRAGMLWNTGNDQAVDKGNVIHHILGDVRVANDVPGAIKKAVLHGVVTENEAAALRTSILAVVTHQKLRPLFEEGNTVWNERDILMPHGPNLRPDRVVLRNKKIHIVDYKTGKKKQAHKAQLNAYAAAYNEMGYAVKQKLIVYISKKINIEII